MKQFILTIILAQLTYGFQVTFQLDASDLDVSSDGIHLAGNFNDPDGDGNEENPGIPWWDPSGIEMTDEDGDEIYDVTLSLIEGTYQYKFINGNDWSDQHDIFPDDDTCVEDGNRTITITTDIVIDPVCLGLCEPCDLSEIVFDNYLINSSYSIITSFESDYLSGSFSNLNYNGRTVIGGMDLDKDGMLEIVVTDYVGHRVIVLEFQNGVFVEVWASASYQDEEVRHMTSPRTVGVSDLDGDGKEEIIFPSSKIGMEGWHIYEWDGVEGSDNYGANVSSINTTEVEVCCIANIDDYRADHERVTIKDIDSDGKNELVIMIRRGQQRGVLITSVSGDIIHNSGNTGSEVWTSEGFFDSENYGGGSPLHSLPADLDGDGSYELVNHTWQNMNFFNIDVQGADSYNILEPGSDASFYQAEFSDNVSLFGGTVADVDGDGNDECFFPSWFYGESTLGGMYLIDYEPQNDVLQINANHVNMILDEPNSLLHASSFDIDGNGIPNVFSATHSATNNGYELSIISLNYDGVGDITLPSSYSVDSLAVYNTIMSIDFYDSAGYAWSDTSTAGYLPKVQSNFEDIPLDFDGDGYKELLILRSAFANEVTFTSREWDGNDWLTVDSYSQNVESNPLVTIVEYQNYQYPDVELSVGSISGVHGDTVLVEVGLNNYDQPLQSIDINFSGFQNKLIFHDIISENYLFGNLGWASVYNNTETLLITASAGAQPIQDGGILFALEMILPDTLSTQFVPVVIEEFLGNEDVTEGSFVNGGVEVVWEPLAGFTSDTTNGYLPLTINFTDTSGIGTYPINEWEWHFGDDSVASGPNVQHTYLEEGNYTVTLVVTDEFGLSDTLEMVDYISALFPVHPTAGFVATTTTGDYPLDILFTDTSSLGTYPIADWSWDFGNDSTGTGSDVSVTYERPGEFDVTLMVTDEYGLSDTLILTDFVQVDTTFGDIDWNTMVQSFDASFILQHLAEMIELDELQLQIADVTQDETISPLDATVILQHVVGLVEELPFTPDESYSASGDLTMSDQGAEAGMQIEIPINITNGSNIYGFTGNLVYDPSVVSLDTILFSDYLDGYLFELNEINNGEIRIVSAGSNPDGEAGVFATLILTVGENFTEETNISITNLRWNEGDVNETPIEMTISFGLGLDVASIPDVFALHQNYPNPFNPTTQIRYDLPEDANVNITIYDIMGRSIRSLVNSQQTAGYRSIQWNATNNLGEPVSAGMYIYTIQAGDFIDTKKMVLLK